MLYIFWITVFNVPHLLGIWGAYITIRYFLASTDGSGKSGGVCALVLGIMSAFVVALVTISLMAPLFPQQSHPVAWRRTRSVLRACYLLLLCAGPVINLVLVIVWHPRQFCGWDIDISWYTSGMSTCRPAPFGAWIAAAIVRLAITWTIVVSLSLKSMSRFGSSSCSSCYSCMRCVYITRYATPLRGVAPGTRHIFHLIPRTSPPHLHAIN